VLETFAVHDPPGNGYRDVGTMAAFGIVSGYSPQCSQFSYVQPLPSRFGSWGRFSSVMIS
jgi:hypothetical protein